MQLFHCNANMQPPLAVGLGVHVGLPRGPIVCSIPSAVGCGPVRHSSTQGFQRMGRPLLAGEAHSTMAQTQVTLPQQDKHFGIYSTEQFDNVTNRLYRDVGVWNWEYRRRQMDRRQGWWAAGCCRVQGIAAVSYRENYAAHPQLAVEPGPPRSRA